MNEVKLKIDCSKSTFADQIGNNNMHMCTWIAMPDWQLGSSEQTFKTKNWDTIIFTFNRSLFTIILFSVQHLTNINQEFSPSKPIWPNFGGAAPISNFAGKWSPRPLHCWFHSTCPKTHSNTRTKTPCCNNSKNLVFSFFLFL